MARFGECSGPAEACMLICQGWSESVGVGMWLGQYEILHIRCGNPSCSWRPPRVQGSGSGLRILGCRDMVTERGQAQQGSA